MKIEISHVERVAIIEDIRARLDKWDVPSAKSRRLTLLAKLECDQCIDPDPHGPSHFGSPRCRNGRSIASGGDMAHCTCSGCH